MDIQFYGGNCIVFSNKNSRVVVDDNLEELGAKSVTKSGDIVLFTGPHGPVTADVKLLVDRPGEYEVSDVSIVGMAAQAHMDEMGTKKATMYTMVVNDIRYLVTGHIYPELSDDQLEAIGLIDVMFVPIGGNGYTLDPVGALKLIKQIEPKLVVPTHYASKGLTYPVEQQPFEEAVKALGMEVKESVGKLRVKPADLGEITQLVVVERS